MKKFLDNTFDVVASGAMVATGLLVILLAITLRFAPFAIGVVIVLWLLGFL